MLTAKSWSRREFLKCTSLAAGGSFCSRAALGLLAGSEAAAVPAGDYRALVCIFLYGGSDGFNLLIPTDNGRYKAYETARGNLALPAGNLLALAGTDGGTYGVHPAASGLRNLYNTGKLAFVANVGTLLQQTSKQDYLSGAGLPPQLYSHNDQSDQWMASQGDAFRRVGWGGRIADLLSDDSIGNTLPMGISIGGNNLFQTGLTRVPYNMSSGGAGRFNVTSNDPNDPRSKLFKQIMADSTAKGRMLEREYARSIAASLDLQQTVSDALAASSTGGVSWPSNGLASQLQMVARIISVRQTLKASRQVFFVGLGSWDTHDDHLDRHALLVDSLSRSIEAFHQAMDNLGVGASVTSFTMSDFGRTLTSNGDGTDHAWGNNHVVAGGSVDGGRIVGTFPDLSLDGPDDAGYGRIIPTTSVEQYGATLARWFGVPDNALQTIFPNLGRFATSDLGFLA
ncbi:MAG: DUF1501 domain-containing protein [Methylotetracoccus sp.]